MTASATSSGPEKKNSSCSDASSAYAVSTSFGSRTTSGHSARIVAITGGSTRPASAASAARSSVDASSSAASATPHTASGNSVAVASRLGVCPKRSMMRPCTGAAIPSQSANTAVTAPAAA